MNRPTNAKALMKRNFSESDQEKLVPSEVMMAPDAAMIPGLADEPL